MEGPDPAAGRGAEKCKRKDARIRCAEPADAAAQAQGSDDLAGGVAKKRKGSGGIGHTLSVNASGQAQGSAGIEPGDLGGGPGTADAFPFLSLPGDMQRLVLEYVPLRDLARLACVSKHLHAAYRDRTQERDAAVTALLESHFTPEFRARLTPAQTALPYDLIVDPPVRKLPPSN
jgi:hypothetical protein